MGMAIGRSRPKEHDMIEGVKEVGVVGTGTMGAGVAQTFAVAGYPVGLSDIGQAPIARGMGAIRKSLERLAGRGKLRAEDRDAALARGAAVARRPRRPRYRARHRGDALQRLRRLEVSPESALEADVRRRLSRPQHRQKGSSRMRRRPSSAPS